jgi:O-methyltransferase involved in polyketide biosynthesis
MKVIIDTSSLLSLVRYYLPFDNNNKLFDFIKQEIKNGRIVVIDEVLKECKFIRCSFRLC